jgi:hypothetical protein
MMKRAAGRIAACGRQSQNCNTLFDGTGLPERLRLLRIERYLTCQISTWSKLSGLSPVCTAAGAAKRHCNL